MADFSVQRGETTIPAASASVTLTAGTDYTAPTDGSKAIVRVTNTAAVAVNDNGDLFDGAESLARPSWSDLGTSFDLERTDTTDAVVVTWEIIEYTAASDNEWVVRDVQTITLPTGSDAASRQQAGTTVSGITDDADVVVLLLGVEGTPSDPSGFRVTTDWDSANDQPIVERGNPSSPGLGAATANVEVAVIEFTGANWTVQRVTHTYTASGTTETETITAVGSLSRAFIEAQMRAEATALDETGNETWLSATDTLSFELQSGATVNDHVAVVWVIENSQTDGTPMSVQRLSASRGTGGGTPDTWSDSITAVAALADASLFGLAARCSGGGSASNRAMLNARLTATDTVSWRCVDDGQTNTYRAEIVEWPTAPTAGGDTNVSATTATLTLTEQAATVNAETNVQASTATLTVTELTASVALDVEVVANLAPLTLTEQAASVNAETNVQTATASLSVTTFAASLDQDTTVSASTASLTLAEQAATVNAETNVEAGTDSLTVSTSSATVNAETDVQAATASLSLTEQSATVNAETDVQAGTQALTLSTLSAAIVLDVGVQATTASLALAAKVATVNAETDVQAATDALTLVTLSAAIDTEAVVLSPTQIIGGLARIRAYGAEERDRVMGADARDRIIGGDERN